MHAFQRVTDSGVTRMTRETHSGKASLSSQAGCNFDLVLEEFITSGGLGVEVGMRVISRIC